VNRISNHPKRLCPAPTAGPRGTSINREFTTPRRARANYATGVVSSNSNAQGPLLDNARWLVSRYTCCNVPTVFSLFSCCS